ncbi:MAG TPA: hypothetical protein VJ483_09865 [Holophagaceae bacterium]|nr:hypothetical protein [Holophagaceae bacterium]
MNPTLRASLPAAAASLAAVLLLACGGGSSSSSSTSAAPPAPAATSLKYTDPAGTDWRLVKDAASTPTHLVLDLVGPAGTLTRGVAFNLQSDAAKVAWGKVNNAYIEDLGVFELVADATDPNEPRLLLGGFKGGMLSVADVQKLPIYTSKDAGQPLFRIAVDLPTSGQLHAGDQIPLNVSKARTLKDNFVGEAITIATGTLSAQ